MDGARQPAGAVAPLFSVGDRVALLVGALACTDDDREVVVPMGTVLKVEAVRETSNPDTFQGPWLYDVCGDRDGDAVWLIYDASDAHELSVIERAPR